MTVVTPLAVSFVVLGVTGEGHCRACAYTPVAKAVLMEAREEDVTVELRLAMDGAETRYEDP